MSRSAHKAPPGPPRRRRGGPPEQGEFAEVLAWDQHACLPLRADAPIDGLYEYLEAGLSVVSVNVGFDAMPWYETVHILANFRRQVLSHGEDFLLVGSADDVKVANATGRLGVCFDLEGADALDGDVAMVETYHRLGVRAMLIAYNQANQAGGGCHGDSNHGLTQFGRSVVQEMNRVGMLVDATHCSYQTTMDIFDVSESPVIFSHSVPSGVSRHRRNISDAQLRGCASTGGVVGINGVGLFLGSPNADTESLFRAVDYAVSIVGPKHVGLGLDYVCDRAELDLWITNNPELFPPETGYGAGMSIAGPSQFSELFERLRLAGYDDVAIRGVMGENFLRVAEEVWPSKAHLATGNSGGAE